MKKKIWILTILATVLCIGGCSMLKKETLTKEQQEMITKNIVKNYNIESIRFISFKKNGKTGAYYLKFIINKQERYQGGLVFSSKEEIDSFNYNIGLSPIDDFKKIERSNPISNPSISEIKITYLEE